MSRIVGVRFDSNDKKLLEKVCKSRRENVSDFVRRTIMAELAELSYLPEADKKALGVLAK